MKLFLKTLILCGLLTGSVYVAPQLSFAANLEVLVPEKTSPIVADSDTSKETFIETITVPDTSKIKPGSFSYAGKGTLKSATIISPTQIKVEVSGQKKVYAAEQLFGYRPQSIDYFRSNVSNALWLYADGRTWQINTRRTSDLKLISKRVPGVRDAAGKYQPPMYEELTAPTGISVKNPNEATWTTASGDIVDWKLVEPATISVDMDERHLRQVSDGGLVTNFIKVGDTIAVMYKITGHRLNIDYRDDTASAKNVLDDVVEGRLYMMAVEYRLLARSKAMASYSIGGKLSYEVDDGPDPYANSSGTVNPKSTKFSNADIPVTLTGHAEAYNLGSRKVTRWAVYARTDDSTSNPRQLFQQIINGNNKAISVTFDEFKIPKGLVTGSDYTDNYIMTFRATLDSGEILETKTRLSSYVFKESPIPEPPACAAPPTAKITAPYSKMAGELVDISGAESTAYGGASIVEYTWFLEGAGGTITGVGGTVLYSTPGSFTIGLMVTDSNGCQGEALHRITMDAPTPAPWPDYTGHPKENRKVVLDGRKSYSPPAYPIISYAWKVTPVSGGGTAADIKYSGTLTGATKDILIKKAGMYLIELTVTNSFGASATATQQIVIAPDEKPIANFYLVPETLRDPARDFKAPLKMSDASYSPDGDVIVQRIWSYRYDSDNDGEYDDEQLVVMDTGNKTELEYLVSTGVGVYEVYLEVVEEFGQPTIQSFIVDSDYRRGKSWE